MKLVVILLCCLVSRACSVQPLRGNCVKEYSCESENDEMTVSPAQDCGISIKPLDNCVTSTETQVMFSCLYEERKCTKHDIRWKVNNESVSNDCDFADVGKLDETGSQLNITNLTILNEGSNSVTCCLSYGDELKCESCESSWFNVCIPSSPMTTPKLRTTTQKMQQTTTMAREQTQSNLGVIVGVSITCGVALLAGVFVFMFFYSKRRRKARKAYHNQQQALHTDVTCNEYVESTMVMTTAAVVGSSVAMSANLAHNIYQEVEEIRSPRNNEVTGSGNHVTNIDVSDGPNRDDIDRLYAKPNKGNKQLRRYGGEASGAEVDHDPSQLYAEPNKRKKNPPKEVASIDQISGDGVDHLYAKPDKKNKRRNEERSHELHDAV